MKAIRGVVRGTLALFVGDGFMVAGILLVVAIAVATDTWTALPRSSIGAVLVFGLIAVLGLTIDRIATKRQR